MLERYGRGEPRNYVPVEEALHVEPEKSVSSGLFGGLFNGLFGGFKDLDTGDILLILILILLFIDGEDDDIIIVLALILLLGF